MYSFLIIYSSLSNYNIITKEIFLGKLIAAILSPFAVLIIINFINIFYHFFNFKISSFLNINLFNFFCVVIFIIGYNFNKNIFGRNVKIYKNSYIFINGVIAINQVSLLLIITKLFDKIDSASYIALSIFLLTFVFLLYMINKVDSLNRHLDKKIF